MTPRTRDMGPHKTWDRLLASPEWVLIILLCACFLSVVAAVVMNALLTRSSWNYFDALKVFAILLGVCGAIYQFVLRRAFESALLIELKIDTSACDLYSTRCATHVHVTFRNIGNRRITAPEELSPHEIALYERSIAFPADLSIRRVREEDGGTATALLPDEFVTWWTKSPSPESQTAAFIDSPRLEKVCGSVSLLSEYSVANGKIGFFMEPGEEYCFSNLIFLSPGHYLAKVVFVGARSSAAEYWSRIEYFYIPPRTKDSRGGAE